ncbi:putative membrane protein [Bradyrhizobium ottawaense]
MTINPKTTAAIGDHPLHPMLIPFPVACLVGAPIADLAFIGTGDNFWARAAMWLIGAGIVMALVAAVAGFTDFFSEPRIRRLNDAWYHMVGNLAAVVLALINFYLRYAQGAEAAIKPGGRGALPDRGRHPPVHGMEGLGDGLPSSRRGAGCAGPDQLGAGHAPAWRREPSPRRLRQRDVAGGRPRRPCLCG